MGVRGSSYSSLLIPKGTLGKAMWVGRARAASLRDGKETAKLVGVKPLQARRQSRQKPRSKPSIKAVNSCVQPGEKSP